jgi:hypothetical protein
VSINAVRRMLTPLGLSAALLLGPVAVPAQAAPQTTDPTTGIDARPFAAHPVLDRLAAGLSVAAPALTAAILAADAEGVGLDRVALDAKLAATIAAANREVLVGKGLAHTGAMLLRVRLAHPDMRDALRRGEAPVLAATPNDDMSTEVVAYDLRGGTVRLDPHRMPERPVLVVEVDTARASALGLALVREELADRGISSVREQATAEGTMQTATTGYWATKVTAIQVADVKEPWLKGNAEIFNIVGGVGLDGKPKVDIVEMPYLDKGGRTYYPNQLLVHFNGYRYNLADVVMMEDDGDTNYQNLARVIATALLTVVSGGGTYIPLVTAIIDAIPTSWWTDDPDYVDSWYTLSTGSQGRLRGAAGNGWMDVTPYWVAPL